ncbi:MAG TPA: SBBP repeat-containing protein [Bryobacteraceae bacterium]|nr:SBBP repeat-containing protein [Bryobacteraceae bacterium]
MFALFAAAVFLAPHYTQILPSQTATGLAVDSAGNAWVVANANDQGQVIKLDPDGNVVFTTALPGITEDAITVDSAGAAYAAGGNSTGEMVITKIGATGSVVYQQAVGQAAPGAIAVDAQGNAYVTGIALGLSATPGAYQTTSKGTGNGFVLKLNASGSQVVYATFIGGSGPPHGGCVTVPFCPPYDNDSGTAIAVDAAGNAYVGGITNSEDFPVTTNAFQPTVVDGWAAKFNPSGSMLIYSTFVPFDVQGLAIDLAGNAYIAGVGSECSAAKLNADGSAALYYTPLGPGGPIGGVALDSEGNLTVTGTAAAGFPITTGTLANGTSFLARLNAAGSAVVWATLLPTGEGGLSVGIDSSGNPITLGQTTEAGVDPNGKTVNIREAGIVTRFTSATAQPILLGATNSASTTVASQLVPGELVSLYGGGLGPSAPIGGSFDASGTLLTSLGGTTAYFNGIAAPLLYAQDQQINAIVPFEVASAKSVTVRVVNGYGQSNALVYPVGSAEPRIFTTNGTSALALNADGTLNSGQNPAQPGSWITVYATGGGLMNPAQTDGRVGIVGSIPESPVSCALVTFAPVVTPYPCTVLYAGSADWLISGGLQVNLQLPAEINPDVSDIRLQVGDQFSVPVALSISQ